jgi:diguanylate cyclase (GGDEF)-like protein
VCWHHPGSTAVDVDARFDQECVLEMLDLARAVRSLIRADDMLFRWGGDEFLVLMFKLRDEEASRRMKSLNDVLEANGERWTSAPVRITVSAGVCGFESLKELAPAIERADHPMYRSRQQARNANESESTTEPAFSN